MSIIAWGTGHRPEHIPSHTHQDIFEIAIDGLREHDISVAICGMASGWDLAFGEAALELEIPVWSVRPWAGHAPRRGEGPTYRRIEDEAERHIITNDSLSYPGPWVYDVRNRWMVDNGEEGLAFWNGKKAGGTWNCIQYAESQGKLVHNLYPR